VEAAVALAMELALVVVVVQAALGRELGFP
jgi:hypothetical protein